MNDFKPGDLITGAMLGDTWKFIGFVDGYSYVVPIEADNEEADAASFIGNLAESGWRLAPKPFFEVGKNYRSNANHAVVITIHYVHEMAHGPVAVGQHTNGTPCMVTGFSQWTLKD